MKTKTTNHEKKPNQTPFFFPCGDPHKMAEMMESCCPDEGGADCCSMMKKMMEYTVTWELGEKGPRSGRDGDHGRVTQDCRTAGDG